MKEVLKGTIYTAVALVAIVAVAFSSVVLLAIAGVVTVLGIGGFLVWLVAALIKEHWESTRAAK